jgi:hypothetical protein
MILNKAGIIIIPVLLTSLVTTNHYSCSEKIELVVVVALPLFELVVVVALPFFNIISRSGCNLAHWWGLVFYSA